MRWSWLVLFSRNRLDGGRGADASKVALVALIERLRESGFTLLDTQFQTNHLSGFGAAEIPAEEYQLRLNEAILLDARFDRRLFSEEEAG